MAMKQQIKSVAQTSEKVKTVRKVSLTKNLAKWSKLTAKMSNQCKKKV